jgi:hypothetical protein
MPNSSTDLVFGDNNFANIRARIFQSTGNIGINQATDAGFRLDVNGTARVQGELTVKTIQIGRGGGDISTNTRVGVSALNANTTGSNNTAFGWVSLANNTTGSVNTAIGNESLSSNISGNRNIGIGNSSLYSNTSGSFNIGIGEEPLFSITTGTYNIALGYRAGRWTGSGTTALTSVNNSIFIGYQSRGSAATGVTNEIVIGYDVVGNGSNTTTLGNTSTTNNYIYGNFNIIDKNIILGTTTGTKIGTATSQKLSLWNATPDVQPTTAITAAAFVANTSGIVDDTATFGGYTLGQIVAALKRIGALA